MFQKNTSREESSVNMKIFISLEDVHPELPESNHAGYFLSLTSMTRFGTYHVIHMQSTNMAKVRTAIIPGDSGGKANRGTR